MTEIENQPYYQPDDKPRAASVVDEIRRERGFVAEAFGRVARAVGGLLQRVGLIDRQVTAIRTVADPTFQSAGDARWGAGTVVYSNPTAMPEAVGGFEVGTDFTVPQTMQQMFDGLLYPYQYPSFSAFSIQGQATTVEVGDAITGSVTFDWTTVNPLNVQANSLEVRDMTNAVDLGTGLDDDGSEFLSVMGLISKSAPASHQWRLRGTNTQAQTFDRLFTVNWRWRAFFGTAAAVTLNEAAIEALANNPLASGFAGTYAFIAGDYKYFAWPDSFGGPSSFKDQATQLAVAMADATDDAAYSNTENGFSYALVSVTNGFGETTNYRVYRTKNVLGGAITIIVA